MELFHFGALPFWSSFILELYDFVIGPSFVFFQHTNNRVLLVPTNKFALWLMLLAFLVSNTRIGSGDAAQSLSKWSETLDRRNLD